MLSFEKTGTLPKVLRRPLLGYNDGGFLKIVGPGPFSEEKQKADQVTNTMEMEMKKVGSGRPEERPRASQFPKFLQMHGKQCRLERGEQRFSYGATAVFSTSTVISSAFPQQPEGQDDSASNEEDDE